MGNPAQGAAMRNVRTAAVEPPLFLSVTARGMAPQEHELARKPASVALSNERGSLFPKYFTILSLETNSSMKEAMTNPMAT
jgi:hypothetical protein